MWIERRRVAQPARVVDRRGRSGRTCGRAATRASARSRSPGCRGPRPGLRRRCRSPRRNRASCRRSSAGRARAGRGPAAARAALPAACPSRSSSSGTARPGVERRAVTLPARVKAGSDLLRRPARRPAWAAAVGRDRPDVEASARERARGVGEQAAVAAPGRHRDDLRGAGQAAAGRRRRAGSRRGSTSAGRDPGGRTRSGAGRATSPGRCRAPPLVICRSPT